jgi:hypothetical protein
MIAGSAHEERWSARGKLEEPHAWTAIEACCAAGLRAEGAPLDSPPHAQRSGVLAALGDGCAVCRGQGVCETQALSYGESLFSRGFGLLCCTATT